MQLITPRKVDPVIIVDSGPSGGMAWNLTRRRVDAALLDAGENPETFFLDTRRERDDDGRMVLGAFEDGTHPEHQ
jgi:hypothetical protein